MTRMVKIQTRSCTWTSGIVNREQDEGDERDAGDAIGLEPVGRGSDGIARVVARAVGDDAGIARVVFLDFEDDLHQVGADIGDLGEDAARHAKGGCAERLTDGEPDKAGAGKFAGDEQQNEQHDQQLDRDQHHADAHARLERDRVTREWLPAERRERGAGVREGVDAHTERRDTETAADPDHAEEQNDSDLICLKPLKEAEIENDDNGDEQLQQHEEFALRGEIGFAGFVNQLGDLPHGRVDLHIAEADENHEAKNEAQSADDETGQAAGYGH